MANSLSPHGLQHARPPCPSPTPGACSNSCPSSHLVLCWPLLLPPSIFPSVRVFSNESVLRIRWPEYWSFSFSISPSNDSSGLISIRMDKVEMLETIFRDNSVRKPCSHVTMYPAVCCVFLISLSLASQGLALRMSCQACVQTPFYPSETRAHTAVKGANHNGEREGSCLQFAGGNWPWGSSRVHTTLLEAWAEAWPALAAASRHAQAARVPLVFRKRPPALL